jgi:hypothetical protein
MIQRLNKELNHHEDVIDEIRYKPAVAGGKRGANIKKMHLVNKLKNTVKE